MTPSPHARALRAPVLLGAALAVLCSLLSPVGAGAAKASGAAERTAISLDPGVGQVVAWGGGNDGAANVPEGLRGVSAVTAGTYHSLAVRADGSVLAWGSNYGRVLKVPKGLRSVTAVSAGFKHSLALRADGTVVAWGEHTHRGEIVVPAGLAGVSAVSVSSGYPGFNLALRSDGSVIAWGASVAHQSATLAGLRGVTAIDAGSKHALALRSDGTVVAWGSNEHGQSDVPAGLRGVVAIAAGIDHSLAVRSDGTVVAWGIDSNGQTRVPAGLRGVVTVSASSEQSVALRSDGSLVSWGFGPHYRTPPVGLGHATSVSLGGSFGLALVSEPWRTCGSPTITAADVTRVAGTDDGSTSGEDGALATQATLRYPHGLARDSSGALHIADTIGYRIRRIDPVTGVLTTVAGQRSHQAGIGDGSPATSVSLDKPSAVAFTAAGDLLIADTKHHRIRHVDRATGIITTFAGTGQAAYGGDGGPAAAASLNVPHGLVVGSDGAVYVADSGNHRVRRVAPDGMIKTVARTGWAGHGPEGVAATASALNFPRGLVLTSDGGFYVSDTYNHRVRRVSASGTIITVAGSGVRGCYGDGGAATAAGLAMPNGLALGSEGSLYIADTANNRIRRVRPDGGIGTHAGTGRPSDWLRLPYGLLAGLGPSLLIAKGRHGQVSSVPMATS